VNKTFLTILASISIATSFSAQSALILSGTRFIYNAENRAIPVTVENNDSEPYGAQVWIENTEDTNSIPFAVTPGVFAVKPNGGKQVVQISQLGTDEFKQDRESLFTIHVQEIPPTPKQDSLSENRLVLASRIVVKMMYRPDAIKNGREKAEEQILISKQGQTWTFQNPTPYYFALISINDDRSLATDAFKKMAPFSQTQLTLANPNTQRINFSAIDDFGGLRNYTCDITKVKEQCQQIKDTL
jgi:P pilus assembly chaperone PapD